MLVGQKDLDNVFDGRPADRTTHPLPLYLCQAIHAPCHMSTRDTHCFCRLIHTDCALRFTSFLQTRCTCRHKSRFNTTGGHGTPFVDNTVDYCALSDRWCAQNGGVTANLCNKMQSAILENPQETPQAPTRPPDPLPRDKNELLTEAGEDPTRRWLTRKLRQSPPQNRLQPTCRRDQK